MARKSDRIVIEKGVPLPPRRGPVSKYPFAEMEVGDSFVTDIMSIRGTAKQAAARYGKKFTVRRVAEGFRVWRIE